MQIIDFCNRALKVSIYRIEGQNKYEEELIIYHVGKNLMPDYFFNKFYTQPPSVKIEMTVYLWKLRRELKTIEQKAHLLFVKIHKFLKIFFINGYIIIPEYISQTLDINRDMINIRKNFHKNLLKTDIRKIRKYNYDYEFTKNFNKLNFFYNEMFIPFVKKRHNNYVHLESLKNAKRLSSAGILFIKKENKYVAGATLQKKGKIIVTRMFGVIHGDEVLFRQSVIAAIFYYLIRFAKEKKYQKIDFGFTNPILNNGILLYKNKWGTRIEYIPFDRLIFMLKVCKLNDSLKRILIDNPLITIVNNKLGACIFSDSGCPSTKISGSNIPITADYFKGLEFIRVINLQS